MTPGTVRTGDVFIVQAFDEVPEHLFQIEDVYEDHMTGVTLTGPLAGEYEEPEIGLIRPAGKSAIPASTSKKIRKIRKNEIGGRMPLKASECERVG